MSIDSIQNVSNAAKSAVSQTAGAVTQTASQYSDVYATINDLVQSFWARVPYLIIALTIFIIFWFLAKLFKVVVRKTLGAHAQRKQNLVMVLNRIGGTVIIFVGFLVAMVIAIPGFTPGQLISALGITSVAIGFAFKDIFQNLLSGIIILLSEPFRIGDQIVSGTFEGTVENILIRATYIKTYDGRRIVIPNATLFTNPVQVNTAFNLRRIQMDLSIGYDDEIETARQIMLNVLNRCPSVYRESPPTVVVTSLSDVGVVMRVRWWIDASAQMNVVSSTDEVLTQLKSDLLAAGISLPIATSPTEVVLRQAEAEPVVAPMHVPRQRHATLDPSEGATPERD